jgi:hypothetical protein
VIGDILFGERTDRGLPLFLIFFSGPVLHEVLFLEDLDGIEEAEAVLLYVRFSFLIVPVEIHE